MCPTLSASLTNMDNMYLKNSMMGYAEIMQAARHWPIDPIPKAIIGQSCAQMQSPMLGSVAAANDRPTSQRFRPKT